MARVIRPNIVVQNFPAVDLGNADGDVTLPGGMVPGDGARLREAVFTMQTAGTGASANHNLTVEHGLSTAGVAITGTIAVDADGTAGTITSGEGLGSAQPYLTKGTQLQLANAESAAISDGAILDVMLIWEL